MNTIRFIVGLISAIIEGKRRIGKSSYSLHIIHDIFVSPGHTSEEDWDMVIDQIIYTIYDIINYFEKSVGDKKKFAFCWDDIGVFGSNLR